jgi:hypothetical protein
MGNMCRPRQVGESAEPKVACCGNNSLTSHQNLTDLHLAHCVTNVTANLFSAPVPHDGSEVLMHWSL